MDSEERLGKNQYNNHWNSESADKCMHAFIGYDKDKNIIVANTLPYDYACWGCGKGVKGSYNYNPTAHIQFEICEGSTSDSDYYWKAIGVAAEYCAYLCKQFGFTQSDICSHNEASIAGYASNHGDPESWMKYFGDTMDKFRDRVKELLLKEGLPVDITEEERTESESNKAQSESASDTPTLRYGSSGEAVKTLQNDLLSLGYKMPKYGADGKFGDETLTALKTFQTDSGLEADGVCGVLTWSAINSHVNPDSVLYTVTVCHLSKEDADALKDKYKTAAVISKEL